METSAFNKLAGELRNNIWELVMLQPHTIHVTIGEKNPSYDPPHDDKAIKGLANHYRRLHGLSITAGNKDPVSDARTYHIKILGLAQTCRQIRSESLPIFCSGNTFQVKMGFLDFSGYTRRYGFA